jgi:hypothetical protein
VSKLAISKFPFQQFSSNLTLRRIASLRGDERNASFGIDIAGKLVRIMAMRLLDLIGNGAG